MLDLKDFNLSVHTEKVFKYFEEISSIPRGSGNMKQIADYIENFAQKFKFRYIRDNADNVIIFKSSAKGYEETQPIILQGHLDIVCQSTEDCKINFLKDGLDFYRDGDFIKARGTTLGADNGIAVAYILTILSSDDIPHPPIEAVFTTDEEIGLLGAHALDTSVLKSKKMINLDSESDDILTVSCAGGQDAVFTFPYCTKEVSGTQVTVTVKGLLGGHSGVEIDKGRVNANILMGRILSYLDTVADFHIISINGGTKRNAIPNSCVAKLCTQNADIILQKLNSYKELLISELSAREPDFCLEISQKNENALCLDQASKQNIIDFLNIVPNGIMEMSAEIKGLVETSLNLGVLTTQDNKITAEFALRSNKKSAMEHLNERLNRLAKTLGANIKNSGFYPPWEFNSTSALRELYKKCYYEKFGKEIKVEAIHAGLECAVFSTAIKDLDCISVGPNMSDVHTTGERLSISSAISTFELLLKVLKTS